MADTDDTQRQPGETDADSEEDAEAERLLAEAVGREVDDDGDPIPAGTGKDTVSREELVKAVRGRQAAKQKARELQAEIAALKAQHETDSEKAIREAMEKATKSMESRYKPALVKASATALLLAAQPKKGKDGIPRLLKLMNLDDIEVGENQEVEGVEEEVERLQADYPELFGDEAPKQESTETDDEKPPTRRTTSRGQDGAGNKRAPAKKLTTGELIMKRMRGEM